MKAAYEVRRRIGRRVYRVTEAAKAAAHPASDILLEAARATLTVTGRGKRYRMPGGGTYKASAPGQAPAMRTGAFRASWRARARDGRAGVETPNKAMALWFMKGTKDGRIAKRPFIRRMKRRARSQIRALYKEVLKRGG